MPAPASTSHHLAPESLAGRTRPRVLQLIGITAGLIGLLSLVAHVRRPKMEIPVGDFTRYFTAHQGDGLPVMLNPGFALAVDGPGTSSRARAVRVGARIVDVEVAARAREQWAGPAYYQRNPIALANVAYNSDLVARIADSLVVALRQVRGARNAARYYGYVRYDGERGATVGYELELGRRSALVFRPTMLALGNWLEAARVAALRGDRKFFAQPACLVMAERAPKLSGISRDARRALANVQALLVPEPPADSMFLARALTGALATLTR